MSYKFQITFLFERVGNFTGFQVFHFGTYTEIKNSENSDFFSKIVHSTKFSKVTEIRISLALENFMICFGNKSSHQSYSVKKALEKNFCRLSIIEDWFFIQQHK